jgi:heat shock protein HslJ
MNKTTAIIASGIGTLILVVALLFWVNNSTDQTNVVENVTVSDFKEATYKISGVPVKLVNGLSVVSDGESTVTTKYFGNEVYKDLNNDGREDVVFLLTEESGGSGVFFYAAAALNTENGYLGSEAILIGDRIAPQTTESGKGNIVIVNYMDRQNGEVFSEQPSVGKSLYLLLDVDSMQFGEVVQDFEGEADVNKMTLQMTTWNWINTTDSSGVETYPNKPNAFTLKFNENNQASITTDCNTAFGEYKQAENEIAFGSLGMTKMYCEGSQETDFINMLSTSSKYSFTSRGELILTNASGGQMIFR